MTAFAALGHFYWLPIFSHYWINRRAALPPEAPMWRFRFSLTPILPSQRPSNEATNHTVDEMDWTLNPTSKYKLRNNFTVDSSVCSLSVLLSPVFKAHLYLGICPVRQKASFASSCSYMKVWYTTRMFSTFSLVSNILHQSNLKSIIISITLRENESL